MARSTRTDVKLVSMFYFLFSFNREETVLMGLWASAHLALHVCMMRLCISCMSVIMEQRPSASRALSDGGRAAQC